MLGWKECQKPLVYQVSSYQGRGFTLKEKTKMRSEREKTLTTLQRKKVAVKYSNRAGRDVLFLLAHCLDLVVQLGGSGNAVGSTAIVLLHFQKISLSCRKQNTEFLIRALDILLLLR